MELAIFPLHTVLVPKARIRLQIFEPRYVDMVKECLQEQSEFVVTLLETGEEVLTPDQQAVFRDTGCTAAIVDWTVLPGDLLGIEIEGRQVASVDSFWQEDSGLYKGRHSLWPAPEHVPLPPAGRSAAEWLQGILSDQAKHLGINWSCAQDVSYRLAHFLPVSSERKQEALEQKDALTRLEMVQSWLFEASGQFNA